MRPTLRSASPFFPCLTLLTFLGASTALAQPLTWTGAGSSSFGLTEGDTSVSVGNPCNSETVTATFSNPDSAALTPFPGLTNSGTTPYIGMNATAVNQLTELELTFGGGLPVENLAFTIFDVDQQNEDGSAWTDELTITAFFGPTATTTTVSCGVALCDWVVSGSGGTTAVVTGDTNNPVFLDPPGQADLTIPGPVDRVVVSYRATGPGTNNQFVGFSDLDFDCSTVPVTVAGFEAVEAGDGLSVRWVTAAETGNLGFEILGELDGRWLPFTREMVPSRQIDSLIPQSYRVQLGAEARSVSRWMLAEVDRRGRKRVHGPFLPRGINGSSKSDLTLQGEIDWGAIHREQERLTLGRVEKRREPREPAATVCQLGVTREGLYRVSFDELRRAGCDFEGVAVAGLALDLAGEPVPVRVVSADESFGRGDHVEFLGRPVESLYSLETLYRLRVAPAEALRVREERVEAAKQATESSEVTRWVEEQRHYSFSSPTLDPWYADRLLAFTSPVETTYPLPVDHVAQGNVELAVDLWGVTDLPDIALDHRVVIALNGVELGEELFGGLTERRFRAQVPDGLLREGTNSLTLRLPADTGAPFDLVHLDRFGLSYPRRTVAVDDRLRVDTNSRRLAASGFSSPEIEIWADEGERLSRLTGSAVTGEVGGFRVAFESGPGGERSYWFAERSAFHRPTVRPARRPSGLLSGDADYLVISHSSFRPHLGALLERRQREGWRTKVVEVEDLYAAYSGGRVDPEAIRSYLIEATEALGVKAVLLVGGDSYDYLDHLGIGSISFIPTVYTATHPVVRHAPADSLLADLDGDRVPDLPIGRLPVRTLAELETALRKTLDHDPAAARALFASDAADGRVSFSALQRELALSLPGHWRVDHVDLDALPIETARRQVSQAFTADTPLVSYLGHSGPMAWSFDNLLTATDAALLPATSRPPLVLAWGCWNGYHSVPQFDTLTHELLLGEGGAAAVVGASGLTEPSSDRALAVAFFEEGLQRGLTLGEALLAAQRRVAAQTGAEDVVVGMTLLGDPALRLSP